MPLQPSWIVASVITCVACSSPAPVPIVAPTPPSVAIDAPPTVATPAPSAIDAAPTTFAVARPAWSVGQTITLTRTFSVRADQREQVGPPTTLAIPLSGLAPLATPVGKDADRAELARVEALLAAAAGSHAKNTELPALAEALRGAFPQLTVTVRSAQFGGISAGQAAFFLELQVAGKLGPRTRLLDASLIGDLLIDAGGLTLVFYAPGRVEFTAGMGGTTTDAAIALGLEAR